VKNIGLNKLVNRGNSAPLAPIPKYYPIRNCDGAGWGPKGVAVT
jgi:hypothetical protein